MELKDSLLLSFSLENYGTARVDYLEVWKTHCWRELHNRYYSVFGSQILYYLDKVWKSYCLEMEWKIETST
jgi:hypothetical protein